MQTVWTFLVYFWLLGGLRTPPQTPPLCVRAGIRRRTVYECVYAFDQSLLQAPFSDLRMFF